jgi:hypothetical protein
MLLFWIFGHIFRLCYQVVNCDEEGLRDKVSVHAIVTQWQGMMVTAGKWCAIGSADQQLRICTLGSIYAASLLANYATHWRTVKTKAQVASLAMSWRAAQPFVHGPLPVHIKVHRSF